MKSESSLHELEWLQECALYEIALNVAPYLQFGQLDKPCADLMINESAKSYQA